MAKRGNSKRDYRQRSEKARQNDLIRAIAIGVILVIAVAVVWTTYNSNTSNTNTASITGGLCKQLRAGPEGAFVDLSKCVDVDVNKEYTATFKLAKGGEFVVELYADKAPITVTSFVFLAREGFYNGLTFHRVMADFMAQGGDPTGSGSGGPGYSFIDEPNDLTFDGAGILAMANSGPNTNGSQFFITFAPTTWLNGLHTIFGKVTSGMDVVNGITLRDPSAGTTPGDVIESITITEK